MQATLPSRERLRVLLAVLHCLGLEKDLAQVGRDDDLGRRLQDSALGTGAGRPRKKLGSSHAR